MAKLTDTQLIVLSAAAARDDGIAVVTAKLNRAAVSKAGASLIARKLMREVRSKPRMPVWRKGEDDRAISLKITRAGRAAIGVEEDVTAQALRASNRQSQENDAQTIEERPQDRFGAKESIDHGAASPRNGTKQALVIEMLCAERGARPWSALVKATGWLPHTTRAALTGAAQTGLLDRALPRGRLGPRSTGSSLALRSRPA